VTSRSPPVRVYGNWILALWELYLRTPEAELFAVFNDDILLYKNLKSYLSERTVPFYPLNPQYKRGYVNLYTVPAAGRAILNKRDNGWVFGWHESDQRGQGGAGLVFHHSAVVQLLQSPIMVQKPLLTNHKAWKNVDGSICDAMNALDFKEHIHYPSLIQLQTTESTIGNDPLPITDCWWGEAYDAMRLLDGEK
jgi:hypothetical protein